MKSYYDSSTYMSNLKEALTSVPVLRNLGGRSLLLTGAGGLICSSIADIVITYNEGILRREAGTGAVADAGSSGVEAGDGSDTAASADAGRNDELIHLYLTGRSIERLRQRFSKYVDREYITFLEYDVTTPCILEVSADYIIHGAGNAVPGKMMSRPVDTMTANIFGTDELLRYAARVGSKRLLYISSSEVYGQKESMEPFTESEYGYVDLLSVRSCYPVAKRAAETLCVSHGAQNHVSTVIVRPGHIYGPTATETDNRISAQFAHDAAAGKALGLKSSGAQIRSYCHVLDCASAILYVLIKGEDAAAYNISNSSSIISIRQLTEYYAAAAGVPVTVGEMTEEEKRSFSPSDNLSLNSDRLEALGWRGVFDARKGTSDTIRVLRDCIED